MKLYDNNELAHNGYEEISLQKLVNRLRMWGIRTQSDAIHEMIDAILRIVDDCGHLISGRNVYYCSKGRHSICYLPVVVSRADYDTDVDGSCVTIHKVSSYTDNENYWASWEDINMYGIHVVHDNLSEIYDEYNGYEIEEDF